MADLKYLLDTNICIYLLNGAPAPVAHKFASCAYGEVSLSVVTWAELCCGMDVHNSKDDLMALFLRLAPRDFDMNAAAEFGKLSRKFPGKKNSFDQMIAAHALALGVILVTNNTQDFQAYTQAGLKLENWT